MEQKFKDLNNSAKESFFRKSKVNNFLIYTLIYITSETFLIYCIPIKPSLNPSTSLKYDSVWSFMYFSYRLSVYFADLSNTF